MILDSLGDSGAANPHGRLPAACAYIEGLAIWGLSSLRGDKLLHLLLGKFWALSSTPHLYAPMNP